MSDRDALIEAYLARIDRSAVAACRLAVAASPAAYLEPHLLRRIRVGALRALAVPVDAEVDLWSSPLVRDTSATGAAFHETALPFLHESFRAWTTGSERERDAARLAASVILSHPSNPLRRAQERVTVAALTEDDPNSTIAETLLPVKQAIEDGRQGVARWADRALPLLPEVARRAPTVWQVVLTARRSADLDIDLGDAAPDASTFVEASDLPLVELPIRRRREVLDLGAIPAGRTSGILVPDTSPRIVEICREPDGQGQRVSIRQGTLVSRPTEAGPLYLRTLAGTVYEVEEPEPERPSKTTPRRARSTVTDLVIVVPGLFGSALQRDGKDLWNLTGGSLVRTLLRGSLARDLLLPPDDPGVFDIDGVIATDVVDGLTIVPGIWRTEGIGRLLKSLDRDTELTDGVDLLTFPWDWRRDIRWAAERLAEEARLRLSEHRSQGNPEARLILVGHGVGGLVAAWFTDVLGGAADTRLLITLGAPFRGSVAILDQIVNGRRVGAGPLRVDLTEMVRSLSSMYQMLPKYPCIVAGGELVRITDLKLPNLDARRAAEAVAVLNELEEAGASIAQDGGRQLVPVVGINRPTAQSAELLDGQLVTSHQLMDVEEIDGDGTVSRVAAFPSWMHDGSSITYVSASHGELPRSDQVLTMLAAQIRFDAESGALRAFRSEGDVAIEVGDSFELGQPIDIGVTGDTTSTVRVVVLEEDGGATIWRETVGALQRGQIQRVTASIDRPGIYRIEAMVDSRPITSVPIVVGLDEDRS